MKNIHCSNLLRFKEEFMWEISFSCTLLTILNRKRKLNHNLLNDIFIVDMSDGKLLVW